MARVLFLLAVQYGIYGMNAVNITSSCNATDCHILCTDYRQCYNEIIDIPTSTNVILDCLGEESCGLATISSTTKISNLIINCFGELSCDWIFIGTNLNPIKITNKATINCYHSGACVRNIIYLDLVASDVDVTINCRNSMLNDNITETSGACQDTNFYVESTATQETKTLLEPEREYYTNNTLSIFCGEFDCTITKLHLIKLEYNSLDCSASSLVYLNPLENHLQQI